MCIRDRACFSKPWSEQTFADELYNDAVSLVVAEGEDGAVLGYGEVSVVLDEGCLEKIAVAEDSRDVYKRQVQGLSNGSQPVLGYNYGAGESHRVRQGIRFTSIVVVLYSEV